MSLKIIIVTTDQKIKHLSVYLKQNIPFVQFVSTVRNCDILINFLTRHHKLHGTAVEQQGTENS